MPCSEVASRCLQEVGGALLQPPKDIIKAWQCHWGLETRALGASVLQTCFVQHVFYFPFLPSSPTPPLGLLWATVWPVWLGG